MNVKPPLVFTSGGKHWDIKRENGAVASAVLTDLSIASTSGGDGAALISNILSGHPVSASARIVRERIINREETSCHD
jgi:hypothetical protein